MKRLSFFLIPLLISCLILTVFAHPGKTDSAGGHRDRSTGEYHYHHGYPAHSHTDRNSDGELDCPYDFVDKTDHGSNSSSGITSSSKIPTYDLSPVESFPSPPGAYTKPDSTVQTSVTKEPIIVPLKYFIVLLLVVGILLLILRSKSRRIQKLEQDLQYQHDALDQNIKKSKSEYGQLLSEQQKRYEARISSLIQTYEGKLADQKKAYERDIASFSEEYKSIQHRLHSVLTAASSGETYYPTCTFDGIPFVGIDIPDEVYFTSEGIPVMGVISSARPYGDWTVYVRPKGFVYHCSHYCGNSCSGNPIHAYEAIKTYRPCAKCGKFFGVTSPDWYNSVMAINRKETKL